MATDRRNIRLSDEQVAALNALANALKISGQRGARLQPFIQWLADVAAGALPETIAALEIAAGCATGEDWHELIEIVTPEYPAE